MFASMDRLCSKYVNGKMADRTTFIRQDRDGIKTGFINVRQKK